MDREAEFRRLFDAHRVAVHAYFTGRTGDRQAATDLTQDAFLRVWQHLDEQALAREPSRQPRPGAPASSPVIAAERVTVVGKAIRELPEDQRVALTMAAVGAMTSGEIADAVGVPAGTVRYRLSMARRALAAALDDYDHAEEER